MQASKHADRKQPELLSNQRVQMKEDILRRMRGVDTDVYDHIMTSVPPTPGQGSAEQLDGKLKRMQAYIDDLFDSIGCADQKAALSPGQEVHLQEEHLRRLKAYTHEMFEGLISSDEQASPSLPVDMHQQEAVPRQPKCATPSHVQDVDHSHYHKEKIRHVQVHNCNVYETVVTTDKLAPASPAQDADQKEEEMPRMQAYFHGCLLSGMAQSKCATPSHDRDVVQDHKDEGMQAPHQAKIRKRLREELAAMDLTRYYRPLEYAARDSMGARRRPPEDLKALWCLRHSARQMLVGRSVDLVEASVYWNHVVGALKPPPGVSQAAVQLTAVVPDDFMHGPMCWVESTSDRVSGYAVNEIARVVVYTPEPEASLYQELFKLCYNEGADAVYKPFSNWRG